MEELNLIEEAEKDINTGNGFTNNLIATGSYRAKVSILALAKLTDLTKKVIHAEDQTKNALKSLERTVTTLNEKDNKTQNKLFWIGIIGLVLAGTQVIQALDIVFNWIGK